MFYSRFRIRVEGFKPDRVFLADGIACFFLERKDDYMIIETRHQPRLREALLDYDYVFSWLLGHGARVSFWKYSIIKVLEYFVLLFIIVLIFLFYTVFIGETVEILDKLQSIP